MRITVVAGGTGGHIFPALCVADHCAKSGMQVACMGTTGQLEQRTLAAAFPFTALDVQAVRVKGLGRQLRAIFKILRSCWHVNRLWRKQRPDIVLTMGGYVTVPVGLVARWRRIPLVVHEQNAVSGFSNRLLAPCSSALLQAYPDSFAARYKAQTVGNPVREQLRHLPAPAERWAERTGPLRLLVLGGSQGALAINNLISKFVSSVDSSMDIELYWQAGPKHYDKLVAQLPQSKLNIRLCPFIDDMAQAYAWADLVIARAGALTIAELCAVGLGGLLVPFPYAVDDHQYFNAKWLAATGAVAVVRESEFSLDDLKAWLQPFLEDRQLALKKANASYALGRQDVSAQIAQVCKSSVEGKVCT